MSNRAESATEFSEGKNYESLLPVELVSLIQSLSMPDLEGDWKFTNLETAKELWTTLSRLLLVSKRWSGIARFNPLLWTLVHLDLHYWSGNSKHRCRKYDSLKEEVDISLKRFHLFLARSNRAPICVVLRAHPPPSTWWTISSPPTYQISDDDGVEESIKLAVNALLRESPRVHALSIQGKFMSVWPGIPQFGNIRRLDVDFDLLDVQLALGPDLDHLLVRNPRRDEKIAHYLH